MSKTYVTILAGGAGTRLWPASTEVRPKQFLDLFATGETLLQSTYRRCLELTDASGVFVLTNEMYADLILEQLPDLGRDQIIGEPSRNNTAACIAYAAFKLHALDPDGVMVVLPSDALIRDVKGFGATLERAIDAAKESDALVTVGIVPDHAHTGYGYIQIGDALNADVNEVKRFTEKPDRATAQQFVDDGGYYWNAGMFIWKVATVIDAFRAHANEIYQVFEAGRAAYNTADEKAWVNEYYSTSPSISVDYAIMEKATNVLVTRASFDWDDLGNWTAVYDKFPDKDSAANAYDNSRVMAADCTNVLVYNSTSKPIAIQGLHNVIVVQTDETTMVMPLDRLDEIKDLRSRAIDKFSTLK